MHDTKREEQLLEALLLLKEESQRLIQRHREVMDEADVVMYELDMLKKQRQRQRGHNAFLRLDAPVLPVQKMGGARWRAMLLTCPRPKDNAMTAKKIPVIPTMARTVSEL